MMELHSTISLRGIPRTKDTAIEPSEHRGHGIEYVKA